ncbi:DUF4381 family protein [Methylobacterium sp. A54F]
MNPVTNPTTSPVTDAPVTLEALRGLHLPGGAAGALQSEVVVALILGFLAALGVGLLRSLQVRARATVRRAALREFEAARALPPEARLVAQARLLRRLARTLDGEAAADAQGADWAARLDRLLATDFFSKGAGRVLVDGLYRRPATDQAALDAELGRLLARVRG